MDITLESVSKIVERVNELQKLDHSTLLQMYGEAVARYTLENTAENWSEVNMLFNEVLRRMK